MISILLELDEDQIKSAIKGGLKVVGKKLEPITDPIKKVGDKIQDTADKLQEKKVDVDPRNPTFVSAVRG